MSFLGEAESQYIDEEGKTRALYYENGLTFMTSPLPPLNIPQHYSENKVTVDEALEFIKEHNLEIQYQEGDGENIKGIWVKSKNYEKRGGVYEGYIPVNLTNRLDKVKVKQFPSDPPLHLSTSKLQKMREMKKLAIYLEQYTIFEYSRNPETFGNDSFIVDPDHRYNLDELKKRLVSGNHVIYRDGKIIVPSRDVKKRLLYYLKVQKLNDSIGVERFSNRTVIQNYYRSLSDFRKVKGQLVFTDTLSMLRWRTNKMKAVKRNDVSPYILPESFEPYFYRNNNIKFGELMIVQNVKGGDLKRALTVVSQWDSKKINSGYYIKPSPDIDENKSVVFSVDGRIDEHEIDDGYPILQYPNEKYAALLFIV